jgi:hypothetical protein
MSRAIDRSDDLLSLHASQSIYISSCMNHDDFMTCQQELRFD